MRAFWVGLLALAVLSFFVESAFAKRGAPKPVAPVLWEGVEYRAPLDVEDMGSVQAFDKASGRKLWETKVYHVWIMPLAERDVQSIFISGMKVENRKLVVRNEAGKLFKVDLKTGRVEGHALNWCIGLAGLTLLFWFRFRRRSKSQCVRNGF